jgi:hypothetical protein
MQLRLLGEKQFRLVFSELDVFNGVPVEQSIGTLLVNSNHASTTVHVSSDGWHAQRSSRGKADLTIEILGGTKYGTGRFASIDTAADAVGTMLAHWDGGLKGVEIPLTLRISGIDMRDHPDSYTTTLTFTISD